MAVKTYSFAKDGNKSLSPHFKVREFRPTRGGTPDGDKILISDKLIAMLEKLSDSVKNAPIIVTDGYRTPAFDISLTGKAGQHTTGKAADIRCNGYDSAVLAGLAELVGFDGIGIINDTAIHVDVRGYKVRFIEKGVKAGTETKVQTFLHTGVYKRMVENKTGFTGETMTYLSNHPYADDLFRKLAVAMV